MSDDLILLRETIPERLYRFAEIFVESLDAAHAAREVGAEGQERALLKDKRVLQVIVALQGHLRETHADLRGAALAMLAKLLLWDPKDAVQPGSMLLKPMDEMPPEVRAAIEGWETKADGSFKVKFASRLKVLEMMLAMTGDIPAANAPQGGVKVIFRGRSDD